jgi:hypothetical protein
MVRISKSQEYFYRVILSNQETIVLSNSQQEAASKGLSQIMAKFGNQTNLSPMLIVERINDYRIETEIFLTTMILEDLGDFKLAKDFSAISDFFLDKGKNLY